VISLFESIGLDEKLKWAYGINAETHKPYNDAIGWAAQFYRRCFAAGWEVFDDWKIEAALWIRDELYSRRLKIPLLDKLCAFYKKRIAGITETDAERKEFDREFRDLCFKMKIKIA
jgi:hypothetical protein